MIDLGSENRWKECDLLLEGLLLDRLGATLRRPEEDPIMESSILDHR